MERGKEQAAKGSLCSWEQLKDKPYPTDITTCLLIPVVKTPEVEIGTEPHPRREKAQLDAPNGISQVTSAACRMQDAPV